VNFILKNNYPAKLVLTVHDSLLFEVDEKKSSEFIDIIRHLMTDWPTHGVPILVDAEIGDTWGELEEIK
jgi:DNA polymerase-1